MLGDKVYIFPLAVFVIIPATFIISYIIAVLNGHVEPGFPYISDTGAESPESCIFGQLLNFSAALVGFTVYIRYKQVQVSCPEGCLARFNETALVLGMVMALGISIVANFQENNVKVVHMIGAFMAFGVGTLYCWIQTLLSWNVRPSHLTSTTLAVRVICCVICTATFVMTFLFDAISKKHFKGNNPRKWYPGDGGFAEHIVSTASEWTMSFAFLVYILTFTLEFQKVSVAAPGVQVHPDFNLYSTSQPSEYAPLLH